MMSRLSCTSDRYRPWLSVPTHGRAAARGDCQTESELVVNLDAGTRLAIDPRRSR
jgi:hypothetical protein